MKFFSVESVRLMCDLMREWGQEPTPALRAAGVRVAWLDDPTCRLPSAAELAFIREYRTRLAHVGRLAVLTGQRYHLAVFGALGMAILSAPTIAQSVQAAIHYQDLSFSWMRFDAHPMGDEVAVYFDDSQVPSDLKDFLLVRDFAAIGTVFQDLTGTHIDKLQVGLSLSDGRIAEGLADHLRAPLTLGVPTSYMRFPARILAQVNRHHSLTAQAMSIAACDALLATGTDSPGTMSSRVEGLILQGVGGRLTHDEIATHMGLSGRHLRRLLEQEGTSYQDIRDRVLSTRAEHLLQSTGLTIAQIAEQLGFADASSFSQSFRRWTGSAPSLRRSKEAQGIDQWSVPAGAQA